MVVAFLHPLAFPLGLDAGPRSACRRSCRGQERSTFWPGFSRYLALDGVAHRFETFETPSGYLIYFDATGFRRDDFKVWVEGDHLFVQASRHGQILKQSWLLPDDVFHNGVTAKLEETNELSIFLPRVPAKPQVHFQVPIEGEQAPASPTRPADYQPSASAPADHPQNGQPQGDQPPAPATHAPGDDVDGTWVDVADDDVAKAKAKGKAPVEGPVLQDTVEQGATHSSDTDQ